MGLFKLTESERLEIINLHNNAKIIKEQATSLVSSAAPAATAAPTDDKSKIMAIQTALNSKYGTSLKVCLLYTSPSPRDRQKSRMPSSA